MSISNPYIIFGTSVIYLFEEQFVDWAAADIPDDWAKSGTHNGTNGVQEDVNGLNLFSDGTLTQINYAVSQIPLITSTTYYYELIVHSVTSGGLSMGDGAVLLETNVNSPGTYTGSFVKGGAANFTIKRFSGTTDMVIRSLKIDTSAI